jgi:hypothetical protein
MEHSEFAHGYRAGLLKAHVDQSAALRLANSGALPRRFRAAHTFWTWVWFLSFPAAIACFVWVRWWVGATILVVGFLLPRAIKRSASEFVLEHALEDAAFYDQMAEAGVLRVSQLEASPEHTLSSAASPQMPGPGEPFASALRDLGNKIRTDSGLGPCENLTDAAAMVLTEITTSTLAEAGSDHLPNPMASAPSNAALGACFMAACLTGISVRLKELDIELDIQDVFARAGFAVFQMYPDEEQAQIISAGGSTFKKLVAESGSRANLQQWIEGVQSFAASYVLTGDKAWIPQLAKLYGSLAAARE